MSRFKWVAWYNKGATWFGHSLRWVVYVILVLTLLVVVIQSTLNSLEKNKTLLEERLSSVMKTPVKMQNFNVLWKGFEPEIQIGDLKIYHPQQNNRIILRIPHIRLELALRQSLIGFQWRLDGSITGLDINLTQAKTGEWGVAELQVLGDSRPETRKIAVNWLLSQAHWSINSSRIMLAPYQKKRLLLSDLSIKNHNFYQSHAFRVYAKLNQQPIKLFADLKNDGDLLQPSSWQGKIYTKLPLAQWHHWLPDTIDAFKLSQAALATEAWFDVKAGHIKQATAQIQVQHLALTHQQQPLAVKQLTALVSWQQYNTHTWQATIQHLQGVLNGNPLALQQLTAYQQHDKLSISAKNANIAQGADFLASLSLIPTSFSSWLIQAKPTGTVQQLRATVDIKQKKLYNANAQIKQFSALATTKTIGVNNLNVWLNHDNNKGYAGLEIKNGSLDLNAIYRESTPVTQLNMLVKWTDLDNAWLIESNRATVKNDDAHGDALLSVWLPKEDMSAAQMQLLASIYQGNLASVWRYVPWPSAGDDTLAWLKQGLVSGKIISGDFLYEGVLLDTPQRPPSTMQMSFKIQDGILNYAPDWPLLQRLNADINLYNRKLTVTANNSQIYQSSTREIVAEIPDLSEPKLYVKAGIDTTGDDLMRLFKETPLKKETAHFADMVGVKGEISGELALELPLSDHTSENMKVAVSAELSGNPIVLRQASEFDLWLSGNVNYQTGMGLSSAPLEGFLLGQPVSVKLQSVLDAGEVAAVQVEANGQLVPMSLKPWLANVTQSMRGKTQYKTLLTVPMSDDPVHIVLDSNLVGWHIDLPEPFKKIATTTLPVHYEMELHSPYKQTGYLVVGSALQSAFEVKSGLINRMMLLLGENWSGELPPQGLWVQGHLARMNVDEWLPWLRPTAKNKTPQDVATVMPKLQSFSVSFDDMAYLGYQLHNVRLGYEPLSQASRFQITSNDLNGEILWPLDEKRPVKLNVQSLNLPFALSATPTTAKKIKPSEDWSMPSVEIKIQELSAKAWPRLETSQLSAMLKPVAHGLKLQNIVLKNPDFGMEGNLDWYWQGQEKTSYQGQITVADVSGLFESFNKPPSLNSQKGHAEIALSWQGNPSELSLPKLSGDIHVTLDKGRVLQLNRTLNMSRILGVLDSDNIKRRLKFDFSDVTQKGLAYDQILFDATLVNGEMHNILQFKSPSAQAQAQGTLDLPSKTLNQHLEVSMPMASVVPYAAAIVAGPVVGGALVAAEALLDNSLTQMTTLHYDINGSMMDPKMQRVKNPSLLWRKWRKPTFFKQPKKKN